MGSGLSAFRVRAARGQEGCPIFERDFPWGRGGGVETAQPQVVNLTCRVVGVRRM